jgi:hypothetical protein
MSGVAEANEIIHWFVITAVHNNELLKVKGQYQELASRAFAAIDPLEKLGCDRAVLLNTVLYAMKLPTLYPKFTAGTLEKLGLDIEEVLNRIRRFTPPSISLPFIEDNEGKVMITSALTAGDLHLSQEIESELRRKAQAYKRMAQLCSSGVIPDYATFRRIAHIWPVIYVNAVTGNPHCKLVANLLEHTDEIERTDRDLRRSFQSLQKRFPGIVQWLGIMPNVLQITASFGLG